MLTLNQYRILSGEKTYMNYVSHNKIPETLVKLRDAGCVENIRLRKGQWLWDVTEFGRDVSQMAKMMTEEREGRQNDQL